jgi:glyoxylase-like metal-dependent hydrolase (beta-lactamase superfamily II)
MGWREALTSAVMCLAGAPLATAATPLPTTQIAPGIYVHAGVPDEASAANEDAIANVGFIVGDTSVLVVDPGGCAREGEGLRAAIREVTDRPIRFVVLTHVHPDHIFGAAAFKDDSPEFVGHAKLPGALAQRGAFYLRNLRRALGEAADGSEIVVPTRLVATSAAFDLGQRVGIVKAHGPDSDNRHFARSWPVKAEPGRDGGDQGIIENIPGSPRPAPGEAVPLWL